MKNHYQTILLTLICSLTFISCVKEPFIEPFVSSPLSEIKNWSQQNDKTSFASQINWGKVSYIQVNDSIQGILAPVIIKGKYNEFITFELEGKRHGWLKFYNLVTPTEMEIKIQSISGQILNAGLVRKAKSKTPKIKNMTMREMNFSTSFWNYIFGTFLQDVTVTAPRLYQSNDYAFFNRYQFDLSLFYDTNNPMEGGGEIYGGSGFVFESYAYPEITNNLTNDCFKEVLNELISNNLKGGIACIIEQFDASKKGSGYDFTIDNNLNLPPDLNNKLITYGENQGTRISLNIATLSNTSKEFIATTIIHEVLHAYLKDLDSNVDHIQIAIKYIEPIAQLLKELYNLDIREARILSTTGLSFIPSILFDNVVASIDLESPVTKNERNSTIAKYANQSTNRQHGTPCF